MENEFSGIAKLTRKHKKVQTLMHYVNEKTIKEEHNRQIKGKTAGIDGITKESYDANLDDNVSNLISRMKRFSYKPKAVRRTYIPKDASDKMRPLGIPSYEDKLVQGSMRNILDEIYENKFYNFSYGFRKGRNAHQAIKKVNEIIMRKKINFIVDADIKGFFDNVDHKWLIKFLEHDIEDKNFIRYIKRFLKAGIIEEMNYYESDKGTPQGGIISPVLANVYLHYVLDIWFEKVVKSKLKGDAYIVRYADDFVCFFQYENEANKFYQSLIKRLNKFGLELSEDKSKIIKFGRFARDNSLDGKTESFDFLGFTHINGKTLTGRYRVMHKTSMKKLKVKKANVKNWLKVNMHIGIPELIKKINKKLIGHYAYYGISGNYRSLVNFRRFILEAFYKVLTRRSQRSYLNVKRYRLLLEHFPIKEPKIYVDIW
ncbi:group II intron reverse transcriptase/maturase [Helicovermis profundi]|uniref:Group II intron reverse transcriptase/maturase n=1 Tax=Helicovermis profundi TaxID=3065157 RepID=A0AAU9E5B5_9FIRM|nr:group II intron reverse transcriptase/maturase [Clostridia bacterium S502]BEP29304.1 group II intron reverse transcriptase/maturase [Clostridia bacterium S502]BEP29829.1 group II intron reverse transcriptase/maturase [Clostridia bacterium S502]